MELTRRYDNLNDAQKQAVNTIEGPVMVVAGPGTGKTELLGVRVARILEKTDTLPENILCLTFTESGAAAMRERLIGIIGKDAYKVAIHTFHSFGTECINQNREYFYNGALFQPADDISRYEILRGIFGDLPHNNPLGSTMNGDYTYQSDTATVIAELKRSGLTSEELRNILEHNEVTLDKVERILIPILEQRVGKTTLPQLQATVPAIAELATGAEPIYEVTPLITVIHDSFVAMLGEAAAESSTKPISAWKKKWTTKDQSGQLIFNSRKALVKLRAVADIYDQYINRLEKVGLYDYEDMILQLVHAMEVHDDLRYNLQEKYLYIMVDEFQDTNLAQMRILENLTNNPVNEGRPNLMVVGDDDQAIYSFQGASLSNILDFRAHYPSLAMIPLTDNYRSRAEILEQSRAVIVQGEDRLEHRLEELDKTLTPHQKGAATFEYRQAETANDERRWIASSIRQKLDSGTKAEDIAILTRKHHEIASLLPFLAEEEIPVTYERQENALDEAPILALELLGKIVVALADGEHDVANGLLPQLLAHPALKVSAKDMWELSTEAYDLRKNWFHVMAKTRRFEKIDSWLTELTKASLIEPLEVMVDRMIGRPEEGSDTEASPLYTYFFGETQLETTPAQYLDHLGALQAIRKALREYITSPTPMLSDFVNFVTLHRQLELRIPITRTVGDESTGAIHVMTAHKSKGLEFPTVYVMNAVDSVWGEKARGRSRLIAYPENLPFAFAGDSADERLRLFYVSMTRAKNELLVSFSLEDDRGRRTLPASFLAELTPEPCPVSETTSDLIRAAQTAWYQPYITPNQLLKDLLAPSLAKYKLSATHLNNFLDLLNCGPSGFLLTNLLHFPSAKSAASSYGSAVHRTIQEAHMHLSHHGERKPVEDILHDFEVQLDRERLSDTDRTFYLQKGSEHLTLFFTQRYNEFTPDQKAELDFKYQDVHVGDAHITGLLDIATIDKKEKTMRVADYKTGKPLEGTPKTEFEKIKHHKYRQQLLFYKLLVEHSRDYHNLDVSDGRLIFVEPNFRGEIVDLPIEYRKEDLERLSNLIEAVWKRIITLDLPDTSAFEPTVAGIIAFEDALLDGTV